MCPHQLFHLDEICNEASVSPNKGRPFLAHPDAHPAIRTFCFLLNSDNLHFAIFFAGKPCHEMPTKVRSPTAHKAILRLYRSNPVNNNQTHSVTAKPTSDVFRLLYFIPYELSVTEFVKIWCILNREEGPKGECKGVGIVGKHEGVVESPQANGHLLWHRQGWTHLWRYHCCRPLHHSPCANNQFTIQIQDINSPCVNNQCQVGSNWACSSSQSLHSGSILAPLCWIIC